MAKYFLSFRLADHGVFAATYPKRYSDLQDAIRGVSDAYWLAPTSFWLFESASNQQGIFEYLRSFIDERADMFILGMVNYKGILVAGRADHADILRDLIGPD